MARVGQHLTPERRAAIEDRLRRGDATNTIAREMGASFTTVHRVKVEMAAEPVSSIITFPTFPDEDIPVDRIIGLMAERSKRKLEAAAAKEWMPIRINSTSPVVIAFVGDPHLGDDGTNWDLLLRDIGMMTAPNVYAVNIGDVGNFWIGSLIRLYADQETSKKTEHKLAKWFLHDSGIRWLLWLLGNHDTFGDAAYILKAMNKTSVPMMEWQAKFTLKFPTGLEVPIFASHDFPGNSQWNGGHANMKAAKMRGGAAIYVSGHKHTWHLHSEEMPDSGEVFWTMRARGYKFLDSHATRHGFSSDKYGATMAAVIDPRADTIHEALTCFPCLERAVMFRDAISQD